MAPTDVELVVRMAVEEGRPQAEIAVAAGITRRTVGRVLRRAKVPPMGHQGRPYTEAESRWIVAMLEEGTPYTEVAATVGRDSKRLAEKFPGYALSYSEIAQINHMKRRFERLIEALGLADTGRIAR